MPAKKPHTRASRRTRRGLSKTAEKRANAKLEPQSNHANAKSWMDRFLDVLKIGVGLANLVVSFIKH